MHPAASVIVFTTSTGFGYGVCMWFFVLLCTQHSLQPSMVLVTTPIALLLITIGLVSSTFHLGHPERAWRALSQWRSSWLSREGVMASITYIPIIGLIATAWLNTQLLGVLVCICAVCASLTVYTTAMIYASLAPIPAWANIWTIISYQTNALATGSTLVLVIGSILNFHGFTPYVFVAIALAWYVKWRYWQHIAKQKPTTNSRTALGLSNTTSHVTMLDPPHSSPNYLLKEMGFVVARKYAKRLHICVHAGFGFSLVLLCISLIIPEPTKALGLSFILSFAILLIITFTIICERYLFFAEAKHVVMNYYRP